jgi:hypothetical protein
MTNQPAEGTFSRLMATTAPMREKQREEQEKAPHAHVATVISPVLETPQPQKEKKQRIAGKKPADQQAPKGSGVSSTNSPSAVPKKREIKRRQPFDVYQDQVDLLKKLSLRDQMNGDIGSMSRMVREALDNYLKGKQV